jgi:hypothetical protein
MSTHGSYVMRIGSFSTCHMTNHVPKLALWIPLLMSFLQCVRAGVFFTCCILQLIMDEENINYSKRLRSYAFWSCLMTSKSDNNSQRRWHSLGLGVKLQTLNLTHCATHAPTTNDIWGFEGFETTFNIYGGLKSAKPSFKLALGSDQKSWLILTSSQASFEHFWINND